MIGLRQEAKSSPKALGRSAVEILSCVQRVCWPLGRGFYSRIEPDIDWRAQLVWLTSKIEFVCSCQGRNKSTGASGACALAPSRLNLAGLALKKLCCAAACRFSEGRGPGFSA